SLPRLGQISRSVSVCCSFSPRLRGLFHVCGAILSAACQGGGADEHTESGTPGQYFADSCRAVGQPDPLWLPLSASRLSSGAGGKRVCLRCHRVAACAQGGARWWQAGGPDAAVSEEPFLRRVCVRLPVGRRLGAGRAALLSQGTVGGSLLAGAG